MDTFDLRLWPEFSSAGGDASGPAIVNQVAIDSRRIDSSHALFVALEGNLLDGHQFVQQAGAANARYALVRNNWKAIDSHPSLILLRVDNPLRAFQGIAKIYRQQLTNTKIISIIGCYGKTMVKDLLQAMIATSMKSAASPESFNSQIGVPLSLFTVKKEHEIALIEAAISQENEMDALTQMIAPDSSILTNLGKRHLTTLGNVDALAAEMIKHLKHPSKKGWALIPEDAHLNLYLGQLNTPIHFWDAETSVLPHAKSLSREETSAIPYRVDFPDGNQFAGQITFGFRYFLDLINIAVKAAWLLGVRSENICKILGRYIPEPMRTEIWKSPIGTTFINDTYCSDPQSIDQALKYLDQAPSQSRKIFVFGGIRNPKQQLVTEYRRIGQAIHQADVQLLLLTGQHPFTPLIEVVKKHSPQIEICQCGTYQETIEKLKEIVRAEDIVLIKGEKKESLDCLTEAFNDSICTNQCFINLAAIHSNISAIRRKIAPGTRVMVMVKAMAYGTDELRISKFLATCGIDILGVSYVDEGVALKRAGVDLEIFVINAAFYEASKIVKWGLQVGVSDKAMIEALALEAGRMQKKIKVHLHIDTGMSRFGCRPEEALELASLILNCPALELNGIMTHFACADNPAEDTFTLSQVDCFDQVIAQLQTHQIQIPWRHAANSGGALRFDFPQYNMIRIGLAVYGLHSSESTQKALDLRLAISLISRIVGINVCKVGETISYGRSYQVTRDRQRIAVLPIGYFDGLHRNYSGKSQVIIRGKKAPMVGKICMDFMMVDITDIPNANIGDSVLIFGEDEHGHYISPQDLAASGNSIVHELITCLGPRIQRIFVHEV